MRSLFAFLVSIPAFFAFILNCNAQDIDKGFEYFELEKYEHAALEFIAAMEIAEKENGRDTEYAKLCLFVGFSFEKINKKDEAIDYYNQSIEVYQSTPNGLTEEYYGTCLNKLAGIYVSEEQFGIAISLYTEALESTKNVFGTEHPSYGNYLSNLGELYYYMGEYEDALPLFVEALECTRISRGKSHSEYSIRLHNLALLYNSMDEFEKALPLYLESLLITENLVGNKHPEYASGLNNLAGLYKDMGQYEKAQSLYNEALEIIKLSQGKNSFSYAIYLSNLATLYQIMGNLEEALSLYLKALDITERTIGKDHSSYGTILGNLAGIYESLGEYENALRLSTEAVSNTINSVGKDHHDYGIRLNGVASLYRSMGLYEKALPLYYAAMDNAKDSFGMNHSSFQIYLGNLAELYYVMGQHENALTFYTFVLDMTYKRIMQNFAFMSETDKNAYFNSKSHYFESFNSFAFQCNKERIEVSEYVYDYVLNYSLINKGLLLKSTSSMKAAVLNSGDTMLVNKINTWMDLNRQIARLYSIEKNRRYQDPEELEEIATTIERQLVRGSQEFSDYKNMQNTNWEDVQKKLGSNEAAIEFISFNYFNKEWTDSTLYCALIVKSDSPRPEMIPLFEEKQLENYFHNTRAAKDVNMIKKLYGEKRGIEKFDNYSSVSYADSLYSLIWKPFDSLLKDIETVFYSPSGLLHTISFAAVPYNDSLLLSDKYNMVYLSSTANLVNPKSSNIDFKSANVTLYGGLKYDIEGKEMLAYSEQYHSTRADDLYANSRSFHLSDSDRSGSWDWLKGTLDESYIINDLLNGYGISTTLLQYEEGNEESFKALAGRDSPDIIHLATHGFFFPDPEIEKPDNNTFIAEEKNIFKTSDNPLIRSGLILSGANLAWSGEEIPEGVDDGILTAYEVSGMDLFNTSLVVLSACETGLGDIKGSEGVYGLQRSFKMAGVDYLIMSLWQVPDKETAEFMIFFYAKLVETKNVREAFAQTQKAMRNEYDPYYWAAFVLIE